MYVTDVADGIRLTPFSAGSGAQMNVARRLMKQRHDALRELSK